MSVEVVYAFGNSNIGVYVSASDRFALLPPEAPEKLERALERNLGVDIIRVTINNSPLLGVLCVMNSHGILLGRLVREGEINMLKEKLKEYLKLEILEELKENALGNLILANDRGAIVSPLIPHSTLKKIIDALDVEVVQENFGGSNLVGAMGVATNKGALLSPLVTDDEVERVLGILKVSKGGIGTVNKGSVFVKGGIVANSKGAIIGYETTGIEVMRIHSSLF